MNAVSSTAVRLPPVPRLTMTPAPVPICPSWVQSMTADTTAATRPSSTGDAARAAMTQKRNPPPICSPLPATSPMVLAREGTPAGHGQPRGQRAGLRHGRSPRTMPE